MGKRNGSLKPISGVLKQLGEELHIEEKREYFEALSCWEELAGPRLAAHTRPLFIEGRVLHVGTEGAVWTQELMFRKNAIMQGVNNRLGRPLVKDVRCAVLEKTRKSH